MGRRPLRLLLSIGLALLLVGPGLLSSPYDPGPRTGTQGDFDPDTLSGGVLQDEHRASARLGAFVDVLASPDPMPVIPGEGTDVTFTFTELNKVAATIRSFEWRLSTLDGAPIKDASASETCSIDLVALGTTSWTTTIGVDPDVYREMMLQGRDRLKVRITFSGSDDLGNTITLTKTLPVHLGQRVAVLVDEDVYPLIKENLTRYEADANIRGYVEFVERTGQWKTSEAVRQLLKALWKEEGITGAILWGHLPIPMWRYIHSDNSTEDFPIPVFYEDLDGKFIDIEGDGLYDRHIWGANDGCEIWVSHVKPPNPNIPATNLDPRGQGTGGGLLGKYYQSKQLSNLKLTRVDPELEFFWVEDCPQELYPDDFSVEWTGRLKVDTSEWYTISIMHGGGVKMWIDGNLVHDRPHNAPWNQQEYIVDIYLDKDWHTIRIVHTENGWGNYTAAIRLMWTSDNILARSINEWLEKSHAYHQGELIYPQRGLLFMDWGYAIKCNMKEPILNKHLKPLYGDQLMVAGCDLTTGADRYIEALDKGHELVSVWSHAGSNYHHINSPDVPEGANTSATSWKIRRTEAGLVTLIWGCKAGNFGPTDDGGSHLSENLVANYAFSTPHGLAAAGATRSMGTTFSNVYWALQNGSSLATGMFAYLDYGYDQQLRERQWPAGGTDRFVEDVAFFGDPFIRIDHRPDDLRVTIDGGARFTANNTVILDLVAPGATAMRLRNHGGDWSSWETFCSTKEWTIGPDLGGRRIEFQARNPWGQGYLLAHDIITRVGIIVDRVGMTINGGSPTTNSTHVTLSLDVGAADVSQLRASFRSEYSEWSDWESLDTEMKWVLPSMNGLRTVHVRIEDASGIWTARGNASITLDTVPPKTFGTLSGDLGEVDWYTSAVTLDLAAQDDGTGVAAIEHRLDGGPWQDVEDAIVVDGDGDHTVDYRSRDIAGNTEDIHSVGFRIDATNPSDLSVTIGDGTSLTNVPMARLSLTAEDAGSGVSMMRFSPDGTEWGPWLPWRGWCDHLLSYEDGEVAVHYQVVDLAGNVAEPVVTTVVLDTTVPRADDVLPGDGATDVPVDGTVVVTFSEPVVGSTLDETNFVLRNEDGTQVKGSLVYDVSLLQATFEPDVDLSPFTTYTLTLGAGITDPAGNVLWGGSVLKWRFTTLGLPPGPPGNLVAEISDCAQLSWVAPVDDGSAEVQGYNVYRMEMGGEGTHEFIHLVLTRDTQYQDHTVEMNTQYHYRVTAFSDVGEGSPSDVASIILYPTEADPVDTTEDPVDGPDELSVDNGGGDDTDMESGAAGFLLPLVAIVAVLAVTVAILNRRKR